MEFGDRVPNPVTPFVNQYISCTGYVYVPIIHIMYSVCRLGLMLKIMSNLQLNSYEDDGFFIINT